MRLIDADALIEFCAERWIPLNIDAVNMQPTIQPEKTQLYKEGATSDLISRQAAIDECNKRGAEHIGYAIAHLPSVQPEPHEGYWIPVHPIQSDDPGAYMCSECETGMWEIRPSSYHYCPNCGAKMKGERNER